MAAVPMQQRPQGHYFKVDSQNAKTTIVKL